MMPDYSRMEEYYQLQKAGARECRNPECYNWAFPENEADIAVGIITDESNLICEECAAKGYEVNNTLPF